MASAQPIQQPCYIYRLPTELLQEILDHLDTPFSSYRHTTERRERRAALRAVCLTSRRLRAAGQPILWRHLEVWSRDSWFSIKPALEASSDRRWACVALHWGGFGTELDASGLAECAALLPNVERLVVHVRTAGWRLLDFAGFDSASNPSRCKVSRDWADFEGRARAKAQDEQRAALDRVMTRSDAAEPPGE